VTVGKSGIVKRSILVEPHILAKSRSWEIALQAQDFPISDGVWSADHWKATGDRQQQQKPSDD
jgi:hypothetical protein